MLAGVYNRTRSIADELAREADVASCATPAELAELADVLVTMVSDQQVSMQLYAAADGFLETVRPGTTVLEMSTVGIGHVKTLSVLLEERGAVLLDVPVSGSIAMAESASKTAKNLGTTPFRQPDNPSALDGMMSGAQAK